MYKMVAVDLDGTMLNSYGEVTENTKRVIKQTIQKGTEVIIASGRSIDSIKTIANEIGSTKYMIAGNGAVVYDIKNDRIVYEKYIPKNKAIDIIKTCEQNSIYYNVYTENGIIAKNLSYNTLYYYKDNLTKPDENRTHINIVENVYDYFEQREEKILKIMICDEHKTVFNSIVRKLKELSEIEVLEVSHMSRKIIKQGTDEIALEYFYTEVSAKDVDKWNALEEIIGLMNISKEEVVTIGDNANDLKMITNAGLGVAMGESAPYVKQSADIIAPTNDEDGVAIILNKIFDLNL